MATLKQLQREKNRLLAQRNKEIQMENMKKQIFQLKHGRKLAMVKNIGEKLGGYAGNYQKNTQMSKRKPKQNNSMKGSSLF